MNENYDNNIYNEPYCVKDGCLYETVERKGKVTMVRLCDYVPVLKSEITFDDGSECRKAFEIGAVHSNGTTMPTVTVTADEMSSLRQTVCSRQSCTAMLNGCAKHITVTKIISCRACQIHSKNTAPKLQRSCLQGVKTSTQEFLILSHI